MAKTIKKEDINEKEIIASFLQEEPTDHASLVSETQESIENAPVSQADPPKEESRRRKGKEQGLRNAFYQGIRHYGPHGKDGLYPKGFSRFD